MKELAGRTAVVTGGGSGIGRATCLALAAQGCRVAVVDRDAGPAAGTVDEIASSGGRASAHVADVSDRERMRALPAEVVDEHGAVHVLVNNAGVTAAGRFEDDDEADLDWIVSINVWGVVHGCRFFLPEIRRAGEGHVVNLSSMVGLLGLPSNAGYSLTKGAVRSFTEALRGELRGSGIGVTVVHPGAVATGLMDRARGRQADRLAQWNANPWTSRLLTSPDAVASRIVRAIEHDRARLVVGPDARALDLWARLVPSRSGLVGRLTNRIEERSAGR